MVKIRQRPDGRYEARPRYQGRRFSVYGQTEAEVQAKLVDLQRQLALDQPPPVGITVAELARRWIGAEQARWKPRTLANYQYLLNRYVLPGIGRVKLAKLTPDRLQRFLDTVPGRASSHVYSMLHRCFTVAVRWGYLPANPCDRVVAPSYRPPVVTLPPQADLAKLLQHCLESDDPYAPLVGVALLTGLRLGELLALRWDDVDFDGRQLVVRRAGQHIQGQWVETAPKTASGSRVVALGEVAVRLLKRQKALVAQARLKAGLFWEDRDLVFPGTFGQPMQGSQANDGLKRLCRQAGVPPLTMHKLRHGHASLGVAAGLPVSEISRRLGHRDVQVTLAVYSHAIADGRQVAEAIERTLGVW